MNLNNFVENLNIYKSNLSQFNYHSKNIISFVNNEEQLYLEILDYISDEGTLQIKIRNESWNSLGHISFEEEFLLDDLKLQELIEIDCVLYLADLKINRDYQNRGLGNLLVEFGLYYCEFLNHISRYNNILYLNASPTDSKSISDKITNLKRLKIFYGNFGFSVIDGTEKEQNVLMIKFFNI